jgi:hypothetical protein
LNIRSIKINAKRVTRMIGKAWNLRAAGDAKIVKDALPNQKRVVNKIHLRIFVIDRKNPRLNRHSRLKRKITFIVPVNVG